MPICKPVYGKHSVYNKKFNSQFRPTAVKSFLSCFIFYLSALLSHALAEEDPIILPPIVINPPPPFVICKGATDPANDEKPVNDETGNQKCMIGGGPPLPGGGDPGGNGDGGGGGVGFGRPVPNNPHNTERDANCSSVETVRQNYAKQEIGPIMPSLRIGDFVRIRYVSNGQRETFEIICKVCSIPAVPVPGTCGG